MVSSKRYLDSFAAKFGNAYLNSSKNEERTVRRIKNYENLKLRKINTLEKLYNV